MLCRNCKSEWKTNEGVSASLLVCPFCRASLASEEAPEFFDKSKDALCFIAARYGVDFLLSEKIVNLFPDIAPGLKEEKELIKVLHTSGALAVLKDNLQSSLQEQEIAVRQGVGKLPSYMDNVAVESMLREFVVALGWQLSAPILQRQPVHQPRQQHKLVNRTQNQEEVEDLKVLTGLARKSLEIIEAGSQLSSQYYVSGNSPVQTLEDISRRIGELIVLEEKNGNETKRRGYDLLRKEIKSRLAIFDISVLMKKSMFVIDTRSGGGMGGAIDQAKNMGREMDVEVLTFLFKESKEVGLNIPGAWNMIQDCNFNYRLVLRKIWNDLGAGKIGMTEEDFFNLEGLSIVKGQKDGGFFMDRNDESVRSKIVEQYMVRRLSIDGQKSLQLVYELVNATAEVSLFNFRLEGADELCGAVYFSDDRRNDKEDGKEVGPLITMGIKTLANGWLRYLGSEKNMDYLGNSLNPLYAENVQVDKALNLAKQDAATYFGKVLPSYVLLVSEALKDSQPDYKKVLTIGYLKRLSSAIEQIDVSSIDGKCGWQAIKVYYVLGLMQLMATNVDKKVSWEDIGQMKRLFVETKLSDTNPSFITRDQWIWCTQQKIATVSGFGGRKKEIDFYKAIKS